MLKRETMAWTSGHCCGILCNRVTLRRGAGQRVAMIFPAQKKGNPSGVALAGCQVSWSRFLR